MKNIIFISLALCVSVAAQSNTVNGKGQGITDQSAFRNNLGIPLVENIAISTWAGSSNITTLGTITTGTVPVARVSGLGTAATTDSTAYDPAGSAAAGQAAAIANAIQRANHTGTQSIATVSGLQTALEGKLDLSGGTMSGGLSMGGFSISGAGGISATNLSGTNLRANKITNFAGIGAPEFEFGLSGDGGDPVLIPVFPVQNYFGLVASDTGQINTTDIGDATSDGSVNLERLLKTDVAGNLKINKLTAETTVDAVNGYTSGGANSYHPSGLIADSFITSSGVVYASSYENFFGGAAFFPAGLYTGADVDFGSFALRIGSLSDGGDNSLAVNVDSRTLRNDGGAAEVMYWGGTKPEFPNGLGSAGNIDLGGNIDFISPATSINFGGGGTTGTINNLDYLSVDRIVSANGNDEPNFEEGLKIGGAAIPVPVAGDNGKVLKYDHATTAFIYGAMAGGGDMVSTNNLSDLANAATARTNLGLGSVENTALSTWAGSSNITTLGTITAGTVPVARILGLGGAATLSVGTTVGTVAAGDDVRFITDLGYTAATRILTSSTGADITLPLLGSADAGLAPASGGGSSNFLRADGTWAAPTISGGLLAANNLSDLTNVATAKVNLMLGNVENTALSTWAGSSNITTLGTITTGTVPVARVSGLGTAATTDSTAYDPAGSAAAGQAAAIANAIQRANHTGTQAIATVSGLQAELDGKVSLTGDQTVGGNKTFSDNTTFVGSMSAKGSSGQVQYNDSGNMAGASNVDIEGGQLRLGNISTPAAPASGGLKFYSKLIAGKSLGYMLGSNGGEIPIQPALHSANIVHIAPASGTTAPTIMGGTLTTQATMSLQYSTGSSNRWSSTVRKRFQTSTTAGTTSGMRMAYTHFQRGNAAGFGGFFFRTQLGTQLNLNGSQKFVGVSPATGALGGDPSALVNIIGMGHDAADASTGNWFLLYNDGSGTATKVDLGTNAARNTTDGYDLIIYNPPNSSTFFVYIQNLTTGVVVLDTSYNTDVPASNTGLALKAECRNGVVAAADNLEIAKMYLETDY